MHPLLLLAIIVSVSFMAGFCSYVSLRNAYARAIGKDEIDFCI